MVSVSAASRAELSAGQWLDRYELVYPVARGGMAQVWLAKLHGQHGFERLVALKTILPAFAGDPRFKRMFVAEAKISAAIQHVNVAQVFDLGEHEGLLYLAMEWVDGESLQELERAAQHEASALPLSVLLRIMADVCAGLHAAHELNDAHGRSLNVVHRDVSPQNILVSSDGVVTLIDFGVVKARRRSTEDTSIGTIKGKLQYMAPEQALGHVLDRRADIWAVGATLYRLLAGRPLFRSSGPLSTFKRLISPAPPEPLPSNVPPALSSIVLKALAFDPAHRYATAAELGAALEGLLRGANQATSRDVADCVQRYLGRRLSTRREALSCALEACAAPETTGHHARGSLGGAAEAKELDAPPRLSIARPPWQSFAERSVAEPAVLESPANQETTRSLGGVPASRPESSRPRPRRRAIAAAGLVALGSVALWALVSSGGGPAPSARPRPLSASPASASSPPVIDATISTERAPPLALQALPLLGDTPSASEPSLVVRARTPSPKRNVKRATLTLAPRKPITRKVVGAPRSDDVTPAARQVVDDGF